MARKILVADDEVDITKLLEYRLQAEGYDVVIAYSGKEALQKISNSEPDLIILDVIMPPPNGYQVCRKLKNDPKYNKIPVILLTAKTSESDKFWGVESGADDYVTKPYNAEELLTKIKKLIKSSV